MAGLGCYFYIQLALAMKSAVTVLAKGPEADDFYWAAGLVEVFFLLKGQKPLFLPVKRKFQKT